MDEEDEISAAYHALDLLARLLSVAKEAKESDQEVIGNVVLDTAQRVLGDAMTRGDDTQRIDTHFVEAIEAEIADIKKGYGIR